MQIINNWRKGWKFWSVQLSALGVLILSLPDVILQAWVALPSNLVDHLPHKQSVALSLFILSIAVRFIQQEPADDPEEK